MKPSSRVALALLAALLLAAGTVSIIFSWNHLRGSDDAELAGWCVVLGLGLSAAAAFLAETVFFPKEPARAASPIQTVQFVVLHHEGIDEPHFDLMLETSPGSPLATWRSPRWPIDQPTELIQLPEHRREYLTYEGEVSGGRGTVRRVAAGSCRVSPQTDGATLLEWGQPPTAPLMLRRIEGNRWSASAN
jgi:hypothetical protein